VATEATDGNERVTVLVARPIQDLTQSVHLLRTTLLVTFPPLVALLVLVAYRVTSAALKPVEGLRAGAEEITGGTRAGRLPVPDSSDEIHRLAVTLNDMLHRLDASRARQRAFVADAAHELRSPLTNMRTELEVAQRLPGSTDWPALSADLLTDVERLSRLVDDLLLLARADDGTPAPPEALPGSSSVASSGAFSATSSGAAGRGVGTRDAGARGTHRLPAEVELGQLLAEVAARYPAVEYERPAVALHVAGDRDALARVVGNLLDNAVRHARSSIRLSVGADGAYRRITVTDDGPGIPAGDRERVFDRFTRLDDARARDKGGSGLGLAIVRELVRRHHGTVTLHGTVPPPGLEAQVRIPILEK
jgi:signal transduction histidine kinase